MSPPVILSETRRVTNKKKPARTVCAVAALTETQASLNQKPHLTSYTHPDIFGVTAQWPSSGLHRHWVLGASRTRFGLMFTRSQDHVLKVLLLLGNFTGLLQG